MIAEVDASVGNLYLGIYRNVVLHTTMKFRTDRRKDVVGRYATHSRLNKMLNKPYLHRSDARVSMSILKSHDVISDRFS